MAVAPQARLFIVEDDPLFLASMRALLTSAGYLVDASTSSTDAALPRRFSEADLVLLDLGLPDRDGFDVLRGIRESADTANKPVLMLTAHDPMKYRLKGLALGADDYIIKPPHRDELLLRIAGLLRRSGCSAGTQEDTSRIIVDNPGGGRGFVNVADVAYICAARNYCYVHTFDDRKLSSATIGELAETLGERFVRAHRSYLINPAKVRAARWASNSAYILEMDTAEDALIPVSRAYRNAVRGALGIADRSLAQAVSQAMAAQ